MSFKVKLGDFGNSEPGARGRTGERGLARTRLQRGQLLSLQLPGAARAARRDGIGCMRLAGGGKAEILADIRAIAANSVLS
jgi:hypothetical protein